MLVGMDNNKLERKILRTLDFRNDFFPTYLQLWKTVSLLLKSEPIDINQKFEFLVEDIYVWKFLKTSIVSRSTSFRNCIEIKIFCV